MIINYLYTPPQITIRLIESSGILCESNIQSRRVIDGSWDEE